MTRFYIALAVLIITWAGVGAIVYRYLDRLETQIILQDRV